MATIFNESFETDGNGTRYTTTIPEFSDGAGDFFTRTNGSNIGSFYDVTGADGDFFFAGMDLDGEGDAALQILTVSGIDVAGFTDLTFDILLAEDDDGTNQDWDVTDFFKVEYQIDGAGFQNLLAIESIPDGDDFNAVPAEDTDFDGNGDGTEVTDVFANFSKSIAGTGALLDLQLTWNFNAGDEDLAIDDIRVSGMAAAPTEAVIAFDLVEGAAQNLTSFVADPDNAANSGAFAGSNFDVFGITDRTVNFDFADDSAGSFASDTFGVVGTGDTNPFFGVEDLDNGDNPGGTGTASWVFDISSASALTDISIDFAAMGDFEAGDNSHTITASIDGGTAITLFDIDADNDDAFDYTMEGGAVVSLNDPLKIDGVVIPNSFTTFTSSALDGLSGSSLEITLTSGINNGGSEVFALRDIVVNGFTGGAQGTTLAIAADDAAKAEGDAGTTPFTFTVTRSGDTSAAGTVDFAVTSATADAADFGGALPSGTVSFAADETTKTVTVDVSGDVDPEQDESFTVTLSNASGGAVINSASAEGIIQNDDGVAITLISDIQGDASTQISNLGRDDASPLLGSVVTIEGVVVGDFQDGAAGTNGDLNGFYVQEEDTDADANALTSEGIFVFDGSDPTVDVANGDVVRVTGTVAEFFGETQLTDVSVEVISSGQSDLATAATLSFPVASTTTNSDGELIADLEAYEGMQVTIPQELTVSDLFTLGRFGDMGLHADGRLEAFTQSNAPSVSGFEAYQDLAVRNTVILDDGSTIQNPTEIPFEITGEDGNIAGQLDAGDDLTAGDTISDLTGVVRFSRGSGGSGDEIYRINATEAPVIENTNPRETEAPDVGGSLKVAAFNVLNFFTSLNDDRNRDNTPLNAGPTPLEPRGANDLTDASGSVARSTQAQTDPLAEFNRQLDKLVSALSEAGADVFGLVEIENEFPGFIDASNLGGQTAVERLISELNAALPSADYKFAAPSNGDTSGDSGDAISVGLIYNAATVKLAEGTTVEVLRDADLAGLGVDPGVPVFDGSSTNRAPIAATFTELSTGESFSVAVNHFKSKGSPGPAGDSDIGDGVGSANQTRLNASIALDAWLKTDPTGSGDPDYMIIGDLNAYAMEDPIQYLLDQGYTNMAPRFLDEGEFEYSFGFPVSLSNSPATQSYGALDYALASASLVDQITGAAEWHINADEAVIFDYNLEFKPQEQADNFYAVDPFRSSDHDPMLVGLSLAAPEPETVAARVDFENARGRDKAVYSLDGEIVDVERLKALSREIELEEAGITISADDGLKWSPEYLTTKGKGLGIFSVRGDRGQERRTIDDDEVMTFELSDILGAGDATEVMFEFAKVRRSGEVELTFYDDGAEIDTVLLAVENKAVSYALTDGQSFDRVDLSVDGKLRLELDAVEFQRIETDGFDFL